MDARAEESFPPAAAALLAVEALRRGIAGGRPAAVVSRLESLAEGVLPGGAGIFAAAFSAGASANFSAGPARPGNSARLFGSLRAIGGAFWRARSAGAEERRLGGSFYTPPPVIDRILALTRDAMFPAGTALSAGEPARTVCDPALGCGFFFLRLAESLREKGMPPAKLRRWAAHSLFGADTDAQAVFAAKALLWLALSDAREEFIPPPGHFRAGDSLLGPAFGETRDAPGPDAVNWPEAFPAVAAEGGFGVVLGNPPYEVLTNFARRPERKILADAIRKSGFYKGALSGQINLYRCFIERGLALLKPGGALSFVVPLSFARDGAAAALRARLLTREKAEEWFLHSEKDRLFAGVTQSACVFRAVRGGGAAASVSLSAGGRREQIPFAELRSQGDSLALPGLDARGLALWRRLRACCPGRIGDVAEARVGEVDQTVHRACMLGGTDAGGAGTILVRGAHLSAFRLDAEARNEKERFLDLPRFLAMKKAAASATAARAGEVRVAQLGIRNMQSAPRLVAALLPAGVYAGNSLNVYSPLPGVDPRFLAGVLNSCWLDWLFRATSGNNNINLREMLALPFPSQPAAEDRGKIAEAYSVCERAAAAGDDPASARAALNAAVGACYGVTDADAEDLEGMLL